MSERIQRIKELAQARQALDRPWDQYGDDAKLKELQSAQGEAYNNWLNSRSRVRNELRIGNEPPDAILLEMKLTKQRLEDVRLKIKQREDEHRTYREKEDEINKELQVLIEEQMDEYETN